MKKLFSLQTDLTDYKYPLIKIVVSLLVILFAIFRNNFFVISAKPLNIVVTFSCLVAGIASIMCIYIAVPELFYVRKNRRGAKSETKDITATPFSLEHVIGLAKENDIIEFEIKSNESSVKIGASSDNKLSSSVFFNKKFYIEKEEFLTAEEFEKELLQYTTDGKINVITLDGIRAEKW